MLFRLPACSGLVRLERILCTGRSISCLVNYVVSDWNGITVLADESSHRLADCARLLHFVGMEAHRQFWSSVPATAPLPMPSHSLARSCWSHVQVQEESKEEAAPQQARVQACIFKVGDDCRQDVLALQVVSCRRSLAGIGLQEKTMLFQPCKTALTCNDIWLQDASTVCQPPAPDTSAKSIAFLHPGVQCEMLTKMCKHGCTDLSGVSGCAQIGLLKNALQKAGLPLYLAPYGVLPTSYECGIIEVQPLNASCVCSVLSCKQYHLCREAMQRKVIAVSSRQSNHSQSQHCCSHTAVVNQGIFVT